MNDGAHVAIEHPAWAVAAFLAGAATLLGSIVYSYFVTDPQRERRLYWWSWLIGGALLAVSLIDRGPKAPLAMLLGSLGVAVSFAFFKTSYLKIGGRIYALNPVRRHPDPPRPPRSAP